MTSRIDGLSHFQLRFHYQNEISDNAIKFFEKKDVVAAFRAWHGLQKAYYQLETKEGYAHWQCHLIFRGQLESPTNAARTALGLADADTLVNVYMKPAQNPQASIAYCQKWPTRQLGPFVWDLYVDGDLDEELRPDPACIYCRDRGCILCSYMLANAPVNP